jgi:hypothetical protein
MSQYQLYCKQCSHLLASIDKTCTMYVYPEKLMYLHMAGLYWACKCCKIVTFIIDNFQRLQISVCGLLVPSSDCCIKETKCIHCKMNIALLDLQIHSGRCGHKKAYSPQGNNLLSQVPKPPSFARGPSPPSSPNRKNGETTMTTAFKQREASAQGLKPHVYTRCHPAEQQQAESVANQIQKKSFSKPTNDEQFSNLGGNHVVPSFLSHYKQHYLQNSNASSGLQQRSSSFPTPFIIPPCTSSAQPNKQLETVFDHKPTVVNDAANTPSMNVRQCFSTDTTSHSWKPPSSCSSNKEIELSPEPSDPMNIDTDGSISPSPKDVIPEESNAHVHQQSWQLQHPSNIPGRRVTDIDHSKDTDNAVISHTSENNNEVSNGPVIEALRVPPRQWQTENPITNEKHLNAAEELNAHNPDAVIGDAHQTTIHSLTSDSQTVNESNAAAHTSPSTELNCICRFCFQHQNDIDDHIIRCHVDDLDREISTHDYSTGKRSDVEQNAPHSSSQHVEQDIADDEAIALSLYMEEIDLNDRQMMHQTQARQRPRNVSPRGGTVDLRRLLQDRANVIDTRVVIRRVPTHGSSMLLHQGSASIRDADLDNMTYEDILLLEERVGIVSRGAPDHCIDALPTFTYAKANQTAQTENKCDSGEQDAPCIICLQNYESGDLLRSLPCLHQFHSQCIDTWLRQNKECPICKSNVC